ncbi:hypothetical protein Scel_83710 [Streptomyces cellostaticus]|nr:hypothetical protein Scel_83710 [Streptomyces cellostaticus]
MTGGLPDAQGPGGTGVMALGEGEQAGRVHGCGQSSGPFSEKIHPAIMGRGPAGVYRDRLR